VAISKVLKWKDAEALIKSELDSRCQAANILDHIQPNPRDDILLLSYKYGENIVKKGKLCLPESVSASDTTIHSFLKDHVKRNVPVAFPLKSNIEIFDDVLGSTASDRTIRSRHIIQPGQLFGLYQYSEHSIGTTPLYEDYSLSSGEVSIYLGLPLNSKETLDQLRREIPSLNWKTSDGHYVLVKQYMESIESTWRCNVIVLPDHLIDSLPWQGKTFLLEASIAQYFQELEELRYAKSARTIGEGLGLSHYSEQIANIMSVSEGRIPAMVSWHSNKNSLPLDGLLSKLQECALKKRIHKTKIYTPYIMVPRLLKNGDAGYYSCQWNSGQWHSPSHAKTTATRKVVHMKRILDGLTSTNPSYIRRATFTPFWNVNENNDRIKHSDLISLERVSTPVKDVAIVPDIDSNKTIWKDRLSFFASGFIVSRAP
jgi:hypothetical protein